jgi:hypothetical protein
MNLFNPEPQERETRSPQNPPSQPTGPEGQFKTIRELDPVKVQAFQEQLQEEQNLSLGILAGGAAAVLGAALWAGISYATGSQFMWLAIGIAILVGWSVRQFGRGMDTIFGIVGAGLALTSSLLGNFLAIISLVAQETQTPLTEVLLYLLNNPAEGLELFVGFFSPIDILFYAFAAYYGYRYSIRQMTREEEESLYRTRTVVDDKNRT